MNTWIELTTISGRKVSVDIDGIDCFQEVRDVKGCGCVLRVCSGKDIYVEETYEKVKDIIDSVYR